MGRADRPEDVLSSLVGMTLAIVGVGHRAQVGEPPRPGRRARALCLANDSLFLQIGHALDQLNKPSVHELIAPRSLNGFSRINDTLGDAADDFGLSKLADRPKDEV